VRPEGLGISNECQKYKQDSTISGQTITYNIPAISGDENQVITRIEITTSFCQASKGKQTTYPLPERKQLSNLLQPSSSYDWHNSKTPNPTTTHSRKINQHPPQTNHGKDGNTALINERTSILQTLSTYAGKNRPIRTTGQIYCPQNCLNF
jgi:hypothetical protein